MMTLQNQSPIEIIHKISHTHCSQISEAATNHGTEKVAGARWTGISKA
jgi:hypothetical protein